MVTQPQCNSEEKMFNSFQMIADLQTSVAVALIYRTKKKAIEHGHFSHFGALFPVKMTAQDATEFIMFQSVIPTRFLSKIMFGRSDTFIIFLKIC